MEWWKKRKFSKNPIEFIADGQVVPGGYYHLDETWTILTGPYETEFEAIFALGKYCQRLIDERTTNNSSPKA